ASRVVSDGAGGAIVVWTDSGGGAGSSVLRAQRVNAAGALLWPVSGIALSPPAVVEVNVKMTSDNAGGAVIAWCDNRNGNFDLFAQRVNASGTALWTANGIAVCNVAGNQVRPRMVSVPSGSVYVCWVDQRNPGAGIYVQLISTQGVPQWTT